MDKVIAEAIEGLEESWAKPDRRTVAEMEKGEAFKAEEHRIQVLSTLYSSTDDYNFLRRSIRYGWTLEFAGA